MTTLLKRAALRFSSPLLVFALFCSTAQAESIDCFEEKPLVTVRLDSLLLDQSPQNTGEWRLPVSPTNPLITEARMKVTVVRSKDTGLWSARVHFSFPDPKPFGIPFSFQRIELSYQTAGGSHAADQDWSDQCSSAGRSLFPGKQWSTQLDLSGTEDNWFIDKPVIRLWGSRN